MPALAGADHAPAAAPTHQSELLKFERLAEVDCTREVGADDGGEERGHEDAGKDGCWQALPVGSVGVNMNGVAVPSQSGKGGDLIWCEQLGQREDSARSKRVGEEPCGAGRRRVAATAGSTCQPPASGPAEFLWRGAVNYKAFGKLACSPEPAHVLRNGMSVGWLQLVCFTGISIDPNTRNADRTTQRAGRSSLEARAVHAPSSRDQVKREIHSLALFSNDLSSAISI